MSSHLNISFFCLCGISQRVYCEMEALSEVRQKWLDSHSGEGHGRTDAKTCAKARRLLNTRRRRNWRAA